MGSSVCRFFFLIVLLTVFVGSVSASPLDNRLLSLVPPGSDVVAGFENHAAAHKHGQLLLTTHADRLDLEDWQALTGVDSKRAFLKVVEVAAAPFGGNLDEHMVLVEGRFNREIIFKSAGMSGARNIVFEGEPAMVIHPFARERGDMLDARWLVILENRIGILGTQWMVQQALRRYQSHANIDMPLMERLSQLRRDVTTWSMLVSPPDAGRTYALGQSNSPWTRFMGDAEVLMVAVRFGSRVRVDFSLHATDQDSGFFEKKAETFAEVFAMNPELTASPSRQRRLRNMNVEPDHVQASIELSEKQFDEWAEQTTRNRLAALLARTPSRGE